MLIKNKNPNWYLSFTTYLCAKSTRKISQETEKNQYPIRSQKRLPVNIRKVKQVCIMYRLK